MAPGMPGEHFAMNCDDCRFPFAIDANNTPKSKLAVCPNCGFAENSFGKLDPKPSQPVSLAQPNKIQRWDKVAFENPNRNANALPPKDYLVKRVVGLSGELIQFRDGDVLINGELVAKPASTNSQVSNLIFDSLFQPNSLPSRLVAESTTTRWVQQNKNWHYANNAVDSTIDWLRYQHIRGYRHREPRAITETIEDAYCYNQNVARKLNQVDQIHAELSFHWDADTELLVQVTGSQFNRLDFTLRRSDGKLICEIGDDSIEFVSADGNGERAAELTLSNYDGQFVCHLNSKPCFSRKLTAIEATDQNQDKTVSLMIGGRHGNLTLNRLRVFRDVHYFTKGENGAGIQLDEDQYFVLGDNSPISVDSRSVGPIDRSAIFGIVTSESPEKP